MYKNRELYDILKKHFRKYPESEFVVCDKDMRWMSPRKIQKSIQRASQKLDINFHYHMLRHTFATRYLEAGVPLKTVSALLGHTQLQLTTDLYMHVTQEALFEGVTQYENETKMG